MLPSGLLGALGKIVTIATGIATAAPLSELCHLASPFVVTPIPVAPNYADNQLSGPFDVDVEFDPTPPFRCGCCEYRQSVRALVGELPFSRDGNPINLQMVDPANPANRVPLGSDRVEDNPDYAGTTVRYGHRGEAQTANERYSVGGSGPNAGNIHRANGCHYHSHDAPGISGLAAGHHYAVNLVFRGEIVCVTAACGGPNPSGAPHTQKEWVVALNR